MNQVYNDILLYHMYFLVKLKSISRQEFNLKYASEDDLTNSDEKVFELDNNFEEFTVRFSNTLSEMIAYEEENDIKMEVYKGEYDDDIEAKLEQVNVELDYNNQEERDEIISNDENEGLTSQKYNALSPCVIIDNIYDQDAIQQVNNNHLKLGSKIPNNLASHQEEVITLDKETANIFEIIKKEILVEFEYDYKGPSPHVVILELTDNLNSNQAILEAANMYRADFNLQENGYLDIIADEAIFHHYRLLNLMRKLDVRFLDKFKAAVDYRITSRVLDHL
ncbi:hypothetical protein RhiirC2_782400 [Rhizophagus irregularis]|uniref:Uncharacterized protein n=1 Tax=Rhizophagus irregularis TaxID=588596 RepID=A0A2N1N366_9GLOM|nr:hypothetical protein RhiirC2_782400 [Rhizophagus irregularis]